MNKKVLNHLQQMFRETEERPDTWLANIVISQSPYCTKPNGWEVWVETGKNNITGEFRTDVSLSRTDDLAFSS